MLGTCKLYVGVSLIHGLGVLLEHLPGHRGSEDVECAAGEHCHSLLLPAEDPPGHGLVQEGPRYSEQSPR